MRSRLSDHGTAHRRRGHAWVADAALARKLAHRLRAVAHPLRLRLVALLCRGELHVGAMVQRLAVPQAIVSQQLRILRAQDLVVARREGGYARYRLNEPHLHDLLCCIERCGRRDGARQGRNGE